MKKSYLFLAAIAVVFAACEPNEPEQTAQVADFENIALPSESVLHLGESGTFESGDFIFQQEVSVSEYGTYYFGNVVSNKTGKEYRGDMQNDMSAAGGAFEGNNFVVWTGSYAGLDAITLKEPAVVPGMYVNNTPWVIYAIQNGDGMSDDGGKPFGKDDYLKLTVTGSLNGKSGRSVTMTLAKGTDFYVKDWTYLPLHLLGKVDAIKFSMESTKKNSYGMTTPRYFAFDNLGAKKK